MSSLPPPKNSNSLPVSSSSSPSSSSSSSSSLFPLRLHNLFSLSLTDENVRLLSQLLYRFSDSPHVEIEAKFGLLLRNDTKTKHKISGISPCIIPMDMSQSSLSFTPYTFLSDVGSTLFTHVNDVLLTNRSSNSKEFPPIMKKSYQITEDHFYSYKGMMARITFPRDSQSSSSSTPVDVNTISPISIMSKRKILDQNWMNLNHPSLDFRVTVASEDPIVIDSPSSSLSSSFQTIKSQGDFGHRRVKYRHSYHFEIWVIDCTKVETYEKGRETPKISHEIEIELLDVEMVRREARKHAKGEQNSIVIIAANLWDHLKTMAKFAFPNVSLPPSCGEKKGNPHEIKRERERGEKEDGEREKEKEREKNKMSDEPNHNDEINIEDGRPSKRVKDCPNTDSN